MIGLAILMLFCLGASAIQDYCAVHQLHTFGNHMQFTKEPNIAEYAIISKFKGLHCCAKGYRSIEWYKDGRPHPWHGAGSDFVIYPESANQTVYTQSVNEDDAGNYTCLLRNDTTVIAHTIQLTVYDKVPEDPKITYFSDNVDVCVDQPVRLFCEAFVGLIDLPDAYSEAVWKKDGDNETLEDDPNVHQVKVSREDGQTFGTYLVIDKIGKKDYGQYICSISKPGKTIELSAFINETATIEYVSPNPVPTKKIIIIIAVAVILVLTVLILNFRYGLALRVHLKDCLGNPDRDEKPNDVQIVYSQNDSDVALGVLLPTLEAKYNYKCGSKELPQDICLWYKNLSEVSQKSHRLVALISPSSLSGKWDCNSLLLALNQLHELDASVCCIFLKELPSNSYQAKNAQGQTLTSLLRKINGLFWDRPGNQKFWLALRLKLPPMRVAEVKESSMTLP